MGRNRKKSGVGLVTYDAFGNATDQQEEGAAPATTQKIDDSKIATAQWSEELQTAIDDGDYLVRSTIEQDDDFKDFMRTLGLDPDRSRDIEIMTALIGAFGEEDGDIYTRIAPNDGGISIITVSTAIDSHRDIKILPDKIVVNNVQFAKGPDAPRGMAFAMLARQAWALRQVSERLGRPVEVYTDALSDMDSWIGVQIWPRMGYKFPIKDALAQAAAARRFTSTDSNVLMYERNPQGQLGIDEWENIVNDALQNMRTNELKVRGRMTVTDDTDPGMQVLMAYGRRSGLWE
jgi:hypothetical protein